MHYCGAGLNAVPIYRTQKSLSRKTFQAGILSSVSQGVFFFSSSFSLSRVGALVLLCGDGLPGR